MLTELLSNREKNADGADTFSYRLFLVNENHAIGVAGGYGIRPYGDGVGCVRNLFQRADVARCDGFR